ncbi:MAG: carbohydrate ABC transporter permease [Treponema sp.]|jgi:multiple sugar transport system permease protein|nr:carbohydrate ABC transporter permease [Treponema sp.]
MVTKRSPLRTVLFTLLVLFIVLFSLFPFLQMLSTSLKYQWDWGNPSLIPTKLNTGAYTELLGLDKQQVDIPESVQKLLDSQKNMTKAQREKIISTYVQGNERFPFFKYFSNSLFFSVISAFVSLVLATFGAYSISRMKYRGQSLIQRGVLFVYMVGGILLLIPLYKIHVLLGFSTTKGGTGFFLMLIYIVQTLPVSLYMLGNTFRTIPYSIEEAAFIEGYGRIQTILKIIVPLSFGAMATVFIYSFMIAWNEYLFASVFLKSYNDLYTLPLALKALFVSKNAIWDRIMAASMMTALPVVVLFMFVQRFLTGNMTDGGVKE